MKTRILQKSLETAAQDIACQPVAEWPLWVVYVIIALRNQIEDTEVECVFLRKLWREIEAHMRVAFNK
jgi:hypothetical protein